MKSTLRTPKKYLQSCLSKILEKISKNVTFSKIQLAVSLIKMGFINHKTGAIVKPPQPQNVLQLLPFWGWSVTTIDSFLTQQQYYILQTNRFIMDRNNTAPHIVPGL